MTSFLPPATTHTLYLKIKLQDRALVSLCVCEQKIAQHARIKAVIAIPKKLPAKKKQTITIPFVFGKNHSLSNRILILITFLDVSNERVSFAIT